MILHDHLSYYQDLVINMIIIIFIKYILHNYNICIFSFSIPNPKIAMNLSILYNLRLSMYTLTISSGGAS